MAAFLLKSRRVNSKSNMEEERENIIETTAAEVEKSFTKKLISLIKIGYSG